jgi:hypothetical protein
MLRAIFNSFTLHQTTIQERVQHIVCDTQGKYDMLFAMLFVLLLVGLAAVIIPGCYRSIKLLLNKTHNL